MKDQAMLSIESLENRLHFSTSPHIISALADNRGKVLLTLDAPLDPSTVNFSTVTMFTAGPSGNPANGDHVQQSAAVKWRSGSNRISVKATLPADTPYEVIVNGSLVTGTDGTQIDGEYNGATVASGNGTPGGNYQFVTTVKSSPIAMMYTSFGRINFKLYSALTPLTVQNFEYYANTGSWDETFVSRNAPDYDQNHNPIPGTHFVLQGGGYDVTPSAQIDAVVTRTNADGSPYVLQNEAPTPRGLSNTIYTIAMAKGQTVNSAADEWFINMQNNPVLDSEDGGYPVFGAITNANGQAIVNNIANLPDADLNPNGPFATLPIVDPTVFEQSGLNPSRDLLIIRRVAMRMAVGPAGLTMSAQFAASPFYSSNTAITSQSAGQDQTNFVLESDSSVLD